MKILIIEDNPSKKESIEEVINTSLQNLANHYSINWAEDLTSARRYLYTEQFDLVIFDMYLPDIKGHGQERDCSFELISEFSHSKNYQSEAIALTQFEVNEVENIQLFNKAGITLVSYDESKGWKTALELKLSRVAQKIKCDFLIFCALAKERSAFSDTIATLGESQNISGMDCQEIQIGDKHGLIIKPNEMGLVSMAIVSSKAIELFQPKIVAMSGICAGVSGESNYLDIIVGKICWEYQTGKWKDGEFKQEPMQASIDSNLKVDLEQSKNDSSLINAVRKNLYATELGNMNIHVAPISSGSAVIADASMMERIGTQHRKMAGLEMEMYALYEAASQSLCKPLYFGAKTVVDMADNTKADGFHDIGCLTSARYVAIMLQKQLERL
ncbi:MAG: response regulator [Colwellia sp.]|uniref:phosphorylase family protein n=1 Tax=Pseudoalteromonas sp. bablab_jr010 TaxID=2755063 RepID=UPI0018F78EC1|nr:response regulator [Pseudoalteromonas sp. bablab_jr010]